jgi:hypothetical protein
MRCIMHELKRSVGPRSRGPRGVLSFLRTDCGKELDFHNDGNGRFAKTALTLWSERRKYGAVLHIERDEGGQHVTCTVFGPGADRAAARLDRLLKRLQ